MLQLKLVHLSSVFIFDYIIITVEKTIVDNLFLSFFYFLTFYAFIPGFISRAFGYKVFKRGKSDQHIALTFDDGPDPVYTEQLLELLDRYQAKATFFVVGAHAKQYPELLLKMKEAGHDIGVHNFEHKSNWFMRPKTVKKHIEMTNDIIEEVTGERSIYYRPPWGIINLFDYRHVGDLNIVLWSAIFGDWQQKLGVKKLTMKLLKKVKPGEILLLHDCGRTFGADVDAPQNMLIALERYLVEAGRKGYQLVNITEMMKVTEESTKHHVSWGKRFAIALWLGWEKVFHNVFKLKEIVVNNETMFYYRLIPYRGQEVQLNNGTSLQKGDMIAELHFDNKKLSNIAFQSKTTVALGVKMIREIERALPQLGKQIFTEDRAKEVKAVYGVSMINRGAEYLGFEVFDLPNNLFLKSTKIYLKTLMKILTPTEKKGAVPVKRVSHPPMPKMLVMSPEKLRDYLQDDIIKAAFDEIASTK